MRPTNEPIENFSSPKVQNTDLDELNAVRAQLGLTLFILDDSLCAGASRSVNIEAGGYGLGHPPGWSNNGAVAEIAAQSGTMRGAISDWSHSPGHWQHIVSRTHTRVGYAINGPYVTCQFR